MKTSEHRVLLRTGAWFMATMWLLLAVPAAGQRGTRTVPADLPELTAQAETIIRGRVISARSEPHPQFSHLMTVVVTLKVDKTFKGTPGETFTFRQYVWDPRDRREQLGFSKGQEFLLLMNAPSRYGLSSPAGQEQGRFRILRNARGGATAVNGNDNRDLLRGVQASAARKGVAMSARTARIVQENQSGPMPLEVLEEAIRVSLENQ